MANSVAKQIVFIAVMLVWLLDLGARVLISAFIEVLEVFSNEGAIALPSQSTAQSV